MSEVVTKDEELPGGWILAELGSICTVDNGRGFKKTEWVSEGLPIIRIQNLKNSGAKFNYFNGELGEQHRVKAGDLLFAWSGTPGTSFGAHIWHGSDAALNQHIFNVRFNSEEIDPKYFYYALNQNVTRYVEQAQGGVGLAHITKGKFMSSTIPLMAIEQQKRIVAKIEELFSHIDAGIEALKKAKQLLKQYRQSVLKAAVTGELTKEWREARNKDDAQGSANVAGGRTPGATEAKYETAHELLERILKERRQKWEEQQLEHFKAKGKMPKDDKWKEKYKEPTPADVENLPDIPDEWEWATLPQLGELNRGKSKHRPRNAPILYGGKYPFVQTGDVRAANGWLNEYGQTYSEEGLKQSRLWPKGTLCITIAANIADTAILGIDACFPDSVVGFIPHDESVNVEFVEFFVRTAKEDLEKYAPATAQKNINLAILETVGIPLLPKEEQIELVNSVKNKLAMTDRLEVEIDAQMLRSDKNKQSILAAAFSGKLVEEIKDVESAADFLKRIKQSESVPGTKARSVGRKKTKTTEKSDMRRPIIDVLKEVDGEIEPSLLMQKAGFDQTDIEDFYYELGDIADQLEEIRPSKFEAKQWPYAEAVKIRLRK